jgi:hypothetical protein
MPIERRTQISSRSCEKQVGKGISDLAWFVGDFDEAAAVVDGAVTVCWSSWLVGVDSDQLTCETHSWLVFLSKTSSRSSRRRVAMRPRGVSWSLAESLRSSLRCELESSRSWVGAGLDPYSSLRFPIRVESQILSRSSARSSVSRQDAGADAVGSMVSARWLLKHHNRWWCRIRSRRWMPFPHQV